MTTMTKDWNRHVPDAELIARGAGFQHLRDRILELAAPQPSDVVVDVGCGTGLLALELACRVERVWAIDISASMIDYLRTKAASADLDNIDGAVASAVSLPLVDACADIVVSNYCFHHLDDAGKGRALDEAIRVLKPGGRLVFGDMMFDLDPADPRNRAVIAGKVRAMLRKGPAGVLRLAKKRDPAGQRTLGMSGPGGLVAPSAARRRIRRRRRLRPRSRGRHRIRPPSNRRLSLHHREAISACPAARNRKSVRARSAWPRKSSDGARRGGGGTVSSRPLCSLQSSSRQAC